LLPIYPFGRHSGMESDSQAGKPDLLKDFLV
jgi:hypothetical protein